MNSKKEQESEKIDAFCTDFGVLSTGEKREVLKTARTYHKLLKENEILPADTIPQNEKGAE